MTHPRGTVSIVIPTRNRATTLLQLLRLLEKQTYPILEVIVVDASSGPLDEISLQAASPSLPLRLLTTTPHLCRQRNLGIQAARGEFVFLCDDDIRVGNDYLEEILNTIHDSGGGGASGMILEERHQGRLEHGSGPMALSSLFVRWLFQLTVWGDLTDLEERFPGSLIARYLSAYYRRKGNTMTAAGWPLVTQVTGTTFPTLFYGLGASVVCREWLLQSPFDEKLDSHGIGDNYGVALGFPGECPILVRTDLPVHHLRETANRLTEEETYVRRVVALHHFQSHNHRFNALSKLALLWSLVGHYFVLVFSKEKRMRQAVRRAFLAILPGRGSRLCKNG